MIIKEWVGTPTTDIRLKAGQKAEQDMAYFLKREFSADKDVWIFNDLRIHVAGDDYAQIDHLVMHRRGFFIIESKSVCDSVEVNEYAEWTRWFNKRPSGMPSPVEQAKRQAKALKDKLQANKELLRKKFLGIQGGFINKPVDVVVAISTAGRITGKGRAQFDDTVFKADLVCSHLRNRVHFYSNAAGSESFSDSEWPKIVRFIKKLNSPKVTTSVEVDLYPKPPITKPVQTCEPKPNKTTVVQDYWQCKCGSRFDIRYANTARYGKSFYRYCPDCRGREKLQSACPKCKSPASLSLTERIVTFTCCQDENHHGIYYKNIKLWVKDKKTLAKEST